MCETNAYVIENGREVLLFQGVQELLEAGGKLHLRSSNGKELVFDGEILEVSLLNHRMLLKRRKSSQSIFSFLRGERSAQ